VDRAILCPCGAQMESQGLKPKELLTILGPVIYNRSMFQCPACRATRYPGDETLDIMGTTRSPGLRRLMARAGSQSTFKEGQEDLKIYAGLAVSAKDVERVAEGIGQQTEAWLCQEREEMLKQNEVLRPDKTIPIFYISYDGTGVPMTPEELKGNRLMDQQKPVRRNWAVFLPRRQQTSRDFRCVIPIRPVSLERLNRQKTSVGESTEKPSAGA
jgi:hypothetical protein